VEFNEIGGAPSSMETVRWADGAEAEKPSRLSVVLALAVMDWLPSGTVGGMEAVEPVVKRVETKEEGDIAT
jgi:hypothetical protein